MQTNTTQTQEFIIDYLVKLGLGKDEANIYMQVLEKGQLTILEISRLCGIERTKVYAITEKLNKEGILEEVIDFHKKFYQACSLDKIKLLLTEKQENIAYLQQAFGNFSGHLNYYQNKNNPTKVLFYRGSEGLKQMLWNELDAKKDIYAYSYRNLQEIAGEKFFMKWSAEAVSRKITVRDLRSLEFTKSDLVHDLIYHPFKGDIIRYISPRILNIITEVDIYNDVVAMFNWHHGEVFGMEIYSDKVAAMQKQIFLNFWKQAQIRPKKVTKELEEKIRRKFTSGEL